MQNPTIRMQLRALWDYIKTGDSTDFDILICPHLKWSNHRLWCDDHCQSSAEAIYLANGRYDSNLIERR